MDWQVIIAFWDSQIFLGVTVGTIVSIITIAVGTFVAERVITRYLRKFSKRARAILTIGNNVVSLINLQIMDRDITN